MVSGNVIGAQVTIGLLIELMLGSWPLIIFPPTYLITLINAWLVLESFTTPIFIPPACIQQGHARDNQDKFGLGGTGQISWKSGGFLLSGQTRRAAAPDKNIASVGVLACELEVSGA